jgi:hypothetical protein
MGEVTLNINANFQQVFQRLDKLEADMKGLTVVTDKYNKQATAGFNQTAAAANKTAASVDKISQETKKAGEVTSKGMSMFNKLGATIAGAFTVGAIINFSKQSVAAYMTMERAEVKLAVTLKNRKSTVDALIKQAGELERTTMFEDSDIMNAQAMLAINIKDEDQLKKLTVATLDLATAKGMDLASAAQAVNMATMGQSRALKSLGIELDLTGTKQERVTKVIDALTTAVGGQAVGALGEEERALHQLQVEADDLSKAWGKLVLTMGNKVLGSEGEASAASNMATALEAMSRSLAGFKVDGLKDMLTLVTDIIFPLKGLIRIWDSLRGSLREMAKEQAASEGASATIEADKIEILALAAAYEKVGIPASDAMVKATLDFKLSLIKAREASDEGSASYKLLTEQINAITEAEKEATKAIVSNIDVEKMSMNQLLELRTQMTNKYGELILTGVQQEDDANKAKLELINKEVKYREDINKKLTVA